MSPFQQRQMYCRNCEAHEIKTEIYFDNVHKSQSGKSIPLEKSTGQPHKCPYSPYALKQKAEEDFIEGRGYMEKPPTQTFTQEVVAKGFKGDFLSEKIDVIEGQIHRLNDKMDQMMLGLKAMATRFEQSLENDVDKRDRMQLLQKIAELEDALKQKGLVQKASEIKPIGHHSELVDDIVQEGQSEEELDLTE